MAHPEIAGAGETDGEIIRGKNYDSGNRPRQIAEPLAGNGKMRSVSRDQLPGMRGLVKFAQPGDNQQYQIK
jgi:hypothetical protein